MIKKITGKQFDEVKQAQVALIDFSATWCGPCKMLAPILEQVSNEMGDTVAFYNVDVDECPDLAQKYGVASIPTLVVLKNGEAVKTDVGFMPKAELEKFIKSAL